MYRVLRFWDRVCIKIHDTRYTIHDTRYTIHDTRYTIHDVFVYRVPNSDSKAQILESANVWFSRLFPYFKVEICIEYLV